MRSSSRPRFLLLTGLVPWVVGFGLTGVAAAQSNNQVGQCGELTKEWTAACSAASGLTLRPQICLSGHLVIEVDLGNLGTLKVDITRDSPSAAAHGGGAAFAPVGSFADWPSEPAGRRGAVEALARCADNDPSLLDRAEKDARSSVAASSSSADSSTSIPARPLMWIVGGLAVIVLLAGLIRSWILSK